MLHFDAIILKIESASTLSQITTLHVTQPSILTEFSIINIIIFITRTYTLQYNYISSMPTVSSKSIGLLLVKRWHFWWQTTQFFPRLLTFDMLYGKIQLRFQMSSFSPHFYKAQLCGVSGQRSPCEQLLPIEL